MASRPIPTQHSADVIPFPSRRQRLTWRALKGDVLAAIEWLGRYGTPEDQRVWREMKAEGWFKLAGVKPHY